jgi:hypothetical protein
LLGISYPNINYSLTSNRQEEEVRLFLQFSKYADNVNPKTWILMRIDPAWISSALGIE